MRPSMPLSRFCLGLVLLACTGAYGCSGDTTLPATSNPHLAAPRGNGMIGAGPAVPVDSVTISTTSATDGMLGAGG